MARKQMTIKGTERADIPESVEEAGLEWLDKRREARRAAEKKKEAKFKVIALMQSHKIPLLKILDEETGEYRKLRVSLEPKLTEEKTGEVESEVGEGASDGPVPSDVHPGLIAQAEKAQAEAGVAENSEGDVVPPEAAAPKKKRGGKKGGR